MTPLTLDNVEKDGISYLININIKLSLIRCVTKVIKKRIDSLRLSDSLVHFLTITLNYMYNITVQDNLSLLAYAYTSFKMYEKIGSANDDDETNEIT